MAESGAESVADPNTVKYRLRPVEFKGKRTHIICYYGEGAVWPTTVSIVNYFLLTDPSCFKFDKTVDFISIWDLLEMVKSLQDKVRTHLKNPQTKSRNKDKKNAAKSRNKDKENAAISDAVSTLRVLDQSESSIRPINIFTSGFIKCPIIRALEYLNIPIRHGWILPNEVLYTLDQCLYCS